MDAEKDAEDAVFQKARDQIEGRRDTVAATEAELAKAPLPTQQPAGIHGDPNLLNKMATPGAGTLPEPGDDEADAATG